ncbi:MAG: gluconokinase [Pseudomonadota bacterium]
MTAAPPVIVCMGVSGSGKSTLAAALATSIGAEYIDADDFHSVENRQKMSAGIPLTDADRTPWMQRVIDHLNRLHSPCVIAHSALRRAHREQLRRQSAATHFLFLQSDPDDLRERLRRRLGHFMSPALIDSQFAALEQPDDEADVTVIDAGNAPQRVLADALRAIEEYRNAS